MSVATILVNVGVQFAGMAIGAGSSATATLLVPTADPINVSLANLASQIVVSSSALNALVQNAVRAAGCSLTT